MIESLGAPCIAAIPAGGPKRGHGGQRNKSESKGRKGRKAGKNNVEMKRL